MTGPLSNGMYANENTFNDSYVSRIGDTDTSGKLGLKNNDVDSGAHIANTQKYINKLGDADGVAGESDTNHKNYSSTNFIANGDNRKVAIGKIDNALKSVSDDVATHETRLDGHDSDITNLTNRADNIEADLAIHENRLDLVEADVATHESRLDADDVTLADHESRLDTAESTGLAPVTAKGDIYTHNGTTRAKLAVGANGKYLMADSSEPTGLKWVTLVGGGGGLIFKNVQTKTGPQQTVNAGSTDLVFFQSPAIDDLSGWDAPNYQYEIQANGRYRIRIKLMIDPASPSGSSGVELMIYKNGSAIKIKNDNKGFISVFRDLELETTDTFVAGDLIQIYFFNNLGVAVNISDNVLYNEFTIGVA